MKTQTRSTPDQLPRDRKSSYSIVGSFTALAAGLALFGGQTHANSQAINFDTGTLAGFTEYNFNPALVTTSFPANGSNGKALRIIANPVPDAAPAAESIQPSTVYTNFYLALDVVNWAVKDQAVVLLGRWNGGLADGNGMILNYDVAQDGDTAGDRKGGQLQINTITPGFSASTLAAADVTFEPGHSYRLILKAVGSIYTGQAYDLNDLTKPLVTFSADDAAPPAVATYTDGRCGFLSFSRDGTAGSTDVTIDNYYAAASDPNTAIAPVIHGSLFTDSGTGAPQVSSRNPTNRFTNFRPPTSGISFTANTYTAGLINASATKLYLNGVDVSASLSPLPPNGSTVNFTTAAGTLAINTIYSARIEVEDTTGALKSTNTFWFDTFSDAYLKTSPVKTVEAEDYNYSDTGGTPSGLWISANPIPVSGADSTTTPINQLPAGYFDGLGNFAATQDVDYSKPGGTYHFEDAEYRTQDRVQITQGSYTTLARDEAGDIVDFQSNLPPQRINDTQRSQYLAAGTGGVLEYQVRLTSPGDWMNYTRSFVPTNYNVYLRCATFGATTVYLDQVTSDPTTTNQTTARLGTFNVANHIMRLNYTYEPLMAGSLPAVLNLSGTNTLRLTMAGTPSKDDRLIVMDYLLFVPTGQSPTYFDDFNDGNDTTPPPAWIHYDPIGTGGFGLPTASFTFPGGNSYRIVAPAPPVPDAGPARAASVRPEIYSDFYVSVDVLNWDDTGRQAFGIIARGADFGLGTTTGYLFSWEVGSGTLPNTDGGGTDLSIITSEAANGVTYPAGQDRSIHLVKGRKYRFTFLGQGSDFTGKIYDITDNPNPSEPVITTLGSDSSYDAGQVGLLVASQASDAGSPTVTGDATFDNFLVTTAEPRLSISVSGGIATLSWPLIPFALQSSPSLSSPAWTTITSGVTQVGNQQVYTVAATGTAYYRLVYP